MDNEITILRKMIRDESEAVAHYTDAADKATNPELKKLLNDIKDEEIVHIGELKQALKTLFGICDNEKEEEGRREANDILNMSSRVHQAYDKVNLLHNQLFQ